MFQTSMYELKCLKLVWKCVVIWNLKLFYSVCCSEMSVLLIILIGLYFYFFYRALWKYQKQCAMAILAPVIKNQPPSQPNAKNFFHMQQSLGNLMKITQARLLTLLPTMLMVYPRKNKASILLTIHFHSHVLTYTYDFLQLDGDQ